MADLVIGGKTFTVVQDSLLPAGKRAIKREWRPSNANDAGRTRRIQYEPWGPVGKSLLSTSGTLATDYTQNLATNHLGRLLSVGKRTAVTVTGSPVTDSGGYAAFAYGSPSSAYGGTEALFGTSDTSGDIVNYFDEQQGYLFAHHGAISTQFQISDWTEIENYFHPNIITHAIDWRSKGYIGFGPGKSVAYRANATATGSTYTDVGAVAGQYARKFALGSDRLWVCTGVNQVTFTLNDYTTFATVFEAGDHQHLANGIGCHGPITHIGKQGGIYSFTDFGKPVPLSRAFGNRLSTLNGAQWADPGWGWHYYTSVMGLRAVSPSGVDNPVGPGLGMLEFTGHAGIPTAIWDSGGELYVAYFVDDTNTYIYRCKFNPQTTPGTGQPDFFPFRYLASTQTNGGFSTESTTNPTIVWGEDGEFAYETISPDQRDDLWSGRRYSTSGGAWYGTTFDADRHLIKTIRQARLHVLNVEPCSTWQLAFTFDIDPWDTTPTYVDCGPELDVPGHYTLRPTNGIYGAPTSGISGRAFKPRLTQTAEGPNAETLPPEVNGVLEVEYDERPELIEEVTVMVELGTNADLTLDILRDFADSSTEGPVKVVVGGKKHWAMVAGHGKRVDIAGDSVEAAEVVLHLWGEDR